jgi:hypothetical protein
MARKMGSSDGIERIGALFEPALAGEEIARIRSKIRLKASEPMLSPAVSSSIKKPGLEWRGRVREGAEKLQRAYGFKSGGMTYYQIRLMRWTRRLSSIAQGPASGVAANAH